MASRYMGYYIIFIECQNDFHISLHRARIRDRQTTVQEFHYNVSRLNIECIANRWGQL